MVGELAGVEMRRFANTAPASVAPRARLALAVTLARGLREKPEPARAARGRPAVEATAEHVGDGAARRTLAEPRRLAAATAARASEARARPSRATVAAATAAPAARSGRAAASTA